MKIFVSTKRRQEGSAVIVVLALLGILLVLVGVNLHALANVRRELKLIEQQQTRRLAATPAAGTTIAPAK